MTRSLGLVLAISTAILFSCAKRESADAGKPAQEGAPAAQTAGAPRAVVHLKDGSKVPGTIVASSQTDMVLAGDDGIERKIPLSQVKSVEYSEAPVASAPAQPEAQSAKPARQASGRSQRPSPAQNAEPGSPGRQQGLQPTGQPPSMPAKVLELPAASEISVRTNEAIDSGTANEGQTFEAQVTRDAKDADGAVVIPHGSQARVMIKSASKGGRFRGASDLVLDLQSVVINGRSYAVDTVDVSQKGKSGLGANKRTATYTGGGAALGAVIGAIAGGGRGAAIGAGAGAGAGALTQILTKGGAIKVPAESVLTFRLDKPLRVTAKE